MKTIFLSWSGPHSRQVAECFKQWLPIILVDVEAFTSSEDLNKGGRWHLDLSRELEKTSFEIVCVTPDNTSSSWLLFEAGALSKSLPESMVSPFLMNLKPSDLPAPLTHFNAAFFDKADVFRLIRDINSATGDRKRPDDQLQLVFETCWSKMNETFTSISAAISAGVEPVVSTAPKVDSGYDRINAILQELLVLTRSSNNTISNPSILFPKQYVSKILADVDAVPRNLDSVQIRRSHAAWRDLIFGWETIKSEFSFFFEESDRNGKGNGPFARVERAVRFIKRAIDFSALEEVEKRRRSSSAEAFSDGENISESQEEKADKDTI